MTIMANLLIRGGQCCRCLAIRSNIVIPIKQKQYSTSSLCWAVRKEVSNQVRFRGPETLGQRVKETTKTTYYTAVVLVGVGVTGLMGYAIFRELLSSFSPQSVYSAAVDRCTENNRVCDLLGDNVKSYGEESRRGRRQHVSHLPYELEGSKGFRIKFHLKGQRRTATVHLDARENSSGWDFRYLFIQLDSYPHEVIVIEDNRNTQTQSSGIAPDERLASLPPPPILEAPSI